MTWFLVFVGGGLGALARWMFARLAPPLDLGAGGFPWATFAANFFACIVLGMGLSLALRNQMSPTQQAFALTGFCGGFSTFSTFAADVVVLLQEGYPGVAITYLAVSIACGTLSIFGILYLNAVTG